jgi:2-C-methyl-D-erythritol 2,4-cyclodiphosphate synthase
MRIGHGYDVHRLTAGRRLILGGVDVPCEMGLDGHSDADVLIHAVMDSLLGAAALGDIGAHFPPGHPEYKNADSLKLLIKVAGMLKAGGFSICNIDATIIAQSPRLAGYVPEMRGNIAKSAGILLEDVNIKATTEEGLGFTGVGLGIAAHCVSLIMDMKKLPR